MRSFRDIHSSYLAADGFLSDRETTGKTEQRRAHWAKLRMYNDHAYFVVLFAQLEQHVNDNCAKLIASKRSSGKWRSRRLWDSIDLDRMPFMRKVALLTDKAKDINRQVDSYYDKRCRIAHGDSASVGAILLPAAAGDFQSLAKLLKAT